MEIKANEIDKIKNERVFSFSNINNAYKYLYYSKGSTFEILITKDIIIKRNLLRIIIMHGAKVKIKIKKRNLKYLLSYILISFLLFKYKKKYDTVIFKPKLFKGELEGKEIYILNNFIINEIDWEYKGKNVNATSDLNKINFNYKTIPLNEPILIAENERLFNSNSNKFNYIVYKNNIKIKNFKPCLYIYNIKKDNNYIYLYVFYQGYEHINGKPEILSNVQYSNLVNDDYKYYSKNSASFWKNFRVIKLNKSTNEEIMLQFKYRDQIMKIHFSRNMSNNLIINDLYVNLYKNKLFIKEDIRKYKDMYYKYIERLQNKNKTKEIYLFQDRIDRADDNAEKLYEYYKNNSNKEIYFILDKKSKCWNRLKEKGYNLVDFKSKKHKKLFLLSNKIISSHAAKRIYDPFYPSKKYTNLEKSKFIFLQHGIIMGYHNGFLDRVNNPNLDLFISSTKEEKKIIEKFSNYNIVKVTGLARFDNYQNSKTGRTVIYAPSWNVKYKKNLSNSKYVKEIQKVLNSEIINKNLKDNDLNLEVILHPEFIQYNIKFINNYKYKILKQDDFLYSKKLSECRFLITDYSSLFFDVLYQKKNVILHKPYKLHHKNNTLKGYEESVYKSNSISELEECITQLASEKFLMGQNKIKNIKKFFTYTDYNNCKRNYKEIERLK